MLTNLPRDGLDPAPRRLQIVPCGDIEESLIERLGRDLEQIFRLCWQPAREFAQRPEWLEPRSSAHRADALLDSLVDWHSARDAASGWLLGITRVDLAAPDRRFVFGEATIRGCCAVVSIARLRDDDARDSAAGALLRLRLLKEVVHELGHVAGLHHCPEPTCVMSLSEEVDAIDRKSAAFCPGCRDLLPPDLVAEP